MRKRLLTACVMVGALAAPFAGYSAETKVDRNRGSETPKEFVKDSAITAQIKAKMATDKLVSATHITVDTDRDGAVQLSGTAKSRAEANKAVALAKSVEGVRSVDNKIRVDANR